MNYEQAVQKLGRKDRIKLATATTLQAGDYYYADPITGEHTICDQGVTSTDKNGNPSNLLCSIDIMYHDTPIITIHPDGCYTLRTGGWFSATTKKRLIEYSPVNWINGPMRRNMSWEYLNETRPCGMFGYGLEPQIGGPWTIGRSWGEDVTEIEFEEDMVVDSDGRAVDHLEVQ